MVSQEQALQPRARVQVRVQVQALALAPARSFPPQCIVALGTCSHRAWGTKSRKSHRYTKCWRHNLCSEYKNLRLALEALEALASLEAPASLEALASAALAGWVTVLVHLH